MQGLGRRVRAIWTPCGSALGGTPAILRYSCGRSRGVAATFSYERRLIASRNCLVDVQQRYVRTPMVRYFWSWSKKQEEESSEQGAGSSGKEGTEEQGAKQEGTVLADGQQSQSGVAEPYRSEEAKKLWSDVRALLQSCGADSDLSTQLQALTYKLQAEASRQEERMKGLEAEVSTLKNRVEDSDKKILEVEKLAKRKGLFMQTVMDYGVPFVLWWGSLWAGSCLLIFLALEYDLVSWQDTLRPTMEHFGLSVDGIDPRMGNLVVAFLVNECLEPIRFPLCIATLKPLLTAARRLSFRKAKSLP